LCPSVAVAATTSTKSVQTEKWKETIFACVGPTMQKTGKVHYMENFFIAFMKN